MLEHCINAYVNKINRVNVVYVADLNFSEYLAEGFDGLCNANVGIVGCVLARQWNDRQAQ
jgi:hypothetical protein